MAVTAWNGVASRVHRVTEGYGLDRRMFPKVQRQDIQQSQSATQCGATADHPHDKPCFFHINSRWFEILVAQNCEVDYGNAEILPKRFSKKASTIGMLQTSRHKKQVSGRATKIAILLFE
jgi:hypothetical protein